MSEAQPIHFNQEYAEKYQVWRMENHNISFRNCYKTIVIMGYILPAKKRSFNATKKQYPLKKMEN